MQAKPDEYNGKMTIKKYTKINHPPSTGLGSETHTVRNSYTQTSLCDLMVLNVSNKP